MLIAYWAAKGGSGASVLTAGHALRAADDGPTLLVDLDGDLPRVLGVPEPDDGITDWLAAGDAVPAGSLDRIAVEVAPNLRLLARGRGDLQRDRVRVFAGLLARSARTVVVDCGSRPGDAAREVVRAADRSVLVTRACYLAMRRAQEHDLAPTEVALVEEDDRALGVDEIVGALGAPVRLRIAWHPSIARAVDAGLLAARVPRRLRTVFAPSRSLRAAS